MSQYIRDRWDSGLGIPRGPVYAITQTADGYLWIGTEAGLVRFDGSAFQMVADAAGTFNLAGVLGLTPDNEGNLWIRLQGPSMLRKRGPTFENPLANLPYSNITAMSRTNRGALLASAPEHGAITHHQGKFLMLATAAGLPRSPVMSIAQTESGDIWVGTRDAGLFRVSSGKTTAITEGLPDPKVNCLLPDERNGLWIGTDSGIVRWNGTELTKPFSAVSLDQLQALAMAQDRDGNVWVGTNSRGLLRVNERGLTALDTDLKVQGEAVTAVFEDREGSLWIGTASGLERLRDSVFVTYSLSEGMPSEQNGPIYADAHGRTWFAPVDGGLYWLSGGRTGRVGTAGLDGDVVYSIAGGEDGLWVGRRSGGLTHLKMANGSWTATTYTKADGLAQNSVYSVHLARDGTVWVGTLSAGVSEFRAGRFRTYTRSHGLASNTIASILEGADGTMWFATPSGLSSLANGRWRTYAASEGMPSANVNSLFEDSAGVLWIGTSSGLGYLQKGRIHTVGTTASMLREQILGIAEDGTGRLWIATSRHVLRAERDRLIRNSQDEAAVREYGTADGLHGVEGVKRHRAVVADLQGRIWFSMNRGLSLVDPARSTGSSAPPIVHIQTMSVDGSPISLNRPARVAPGSQRIALGFAGLSLSMPERVQFRYRLDGFDHDWNGPVSAREAVYTNLNPGSYRFHVVASNPDGIWSGAEASLEFEIEPEFWQTLWFRLGVVITCVAGVIAIYRYRLHQLTSELNVRFEERLAERTRIAQELHDTLLQGFLSASMQLHVAAERVADESPAKPLLARIQQLMGQVIEEGRNAVRGLRMPQASSIDLAQAFAQIRQEMAVDDSIEFRVITEGQQRPLHPVLRDEIYRIGREALMNAFRHSRARNVEAEIDYGSKQFRLSVRDNGCGIDDGVLAAGRVGHWGLPGMRERAETIGAQLHVWSSAGAGTEVVLSVPGSMAYQVHPAKKPRKWIQRMVSRKNGGKP